MDMKPLIMKRLFACCFTGLCILATYLITNNTLVINGGHSYERNEGSVQGKYHLRVSHSKTSQIDYEDEVNQEVVYNTIPQMNMENFDDKVVPSVINNELTLVARFQIETIKYLDKSDGNGWLIKPVINLERIFSNDTEFNDILVKRYLRQKRRKYWSVFVDFISDAVTKDCIFNPFATEVTGASGQKEVRIISHGTGRSLAIASTKEDEYDSINSVMCKRKIRILDLSNIGTSNGGTIWQRGIEPPRNNFITMFDNSKYQMEIDQFDLSYALFVFNVYKVE